MAVWLKTFVCAACGHTFARGDVDPYDPGWMTCTECKCPASLYLGGMRMIEEDE